MNRMQEKYQKEVVPALRKAFMYKNVMQVPHIEKIVVNIGLGGKPWTIRKCWKRRWAT